MGERRNRPAIPSPRQAPNPARKASVLEIEVIAGPKVLNLVRKVDNRDGFTESADRSQIKSQIAKEFTPRLLQLTEKHTFSLSKVKCPHSPRKRNFQDTNPTFLPQRKRSMQHAPAMFTQLVSAGLICGLNRLFQNARAQSNVGERVAIHDVKEAIECILQNTRQATAPGYRAGAACRKTFDNREIGLGGAQNVAETNFARRLRQAQPARPAANGIEEAFTGQSVNDLHKVCSRNPVRARNLVNRDEFVLGAFNVDEDA